MADVYVAVGSNIAPERNVPRALHLLSEKVSIRAISTFYRTAPLGRPQDPSFHNGVLRCESDLPPPVLKHSVLRKIERSLGRVRTEDRNAPRPIDLDILVYLPDAPSQAPLAFSDPDVLDREFLAIPLQEIAPHLVLPGIGLPITQVAEKLAGRHMEPLPAYPQVPLPSFSTGGTRHDH